MCNPAILIAAGAAATIGGQLYSGVIASQNAKYAGQVADMNRERANEQAVDALNRGAQEHQIHYREVAATMGSQTARLAANGIDVSSGSARDVIGDTAMIGEEDSRTIAQNTYREMRGFEIDSLNYEAERRAAKRERAGIPMAVGLGIAQTALGAATQYGDVKARRSGG